MPVAASRLPSCCSARPCQKSRRPSNGSGIAPSGRAVNQRLASAHAPSSRASRARSHCSCQLAGSSGQRVSTAAPPLPAASRTRAAATAADRSCRLGGRASSRPGSGRSGSLSRRAASSLDASMGKRWVSSSSSCSPSERWSRPPANRARPMARAVFGAGCCCFRQVRPDVPSPSSARPRASS